MSISIRSTYLVCCDSDDNHNKFYQMIPSPDGLSFDVEFGRVGAKSQTSHYPITQWDKKYYEKIKKGYKDVTDLRVVKTDNNGNMVKDFSDVTDSSVLALINELRGFARDLIQNNYTVDAKVVTPAMIHSVEDQLSTLEGYLIKLRGLCIPNSMDSQTKMWQFEGVDISNTVISTIDIFNKVLLNIFTTIPRKMANLKDYVLNMDKISVGVGHPAFVAMGRDVCKLDDRVFNKMTALIKVEHDLLDTMRVVAQQTQSSTSVSGLTLESLGLEIKPCSDKDIALIKKELGDQVKYFDKAWCVKHIESNKRFEQFKKDNKGDYSRFPCKLLWHGSRNENWWSIINTCLKLNPNNAKITGKMFGAGLYFAPKAKKSMGYTSLDGYWTHESNNVGYMALYATAYGKPYNTDNNYNFNRNFGWKDLKKLDSEAHCVHAHAGKQLYNDEIIFYNEDQVTIKYIVRFKK